MLHHNIIEAVTPEMLEKLEEIVNINSFRYNPTGIDQTGKIVSTWFEPLGFISKSIQSTIHGAGHHVVLSKKGLSKTNLIYIAHLDTVYPEKETSESNFRFHREDNRIFGPGTADCKGGIALFWLIMTSLKKANPILFDDLSCTFMLNATEEGGCVDFPEILRQQINIHTLSSIGLEPGLLLDEKNDGSGFITARKGSRRYLLEVTGREAHSGANHTYGVNAIREIARKIEEIEQLTEYDKGITLNVGTVSGGTSVNTIPGYAKTEIDIRFERSKDVDPVISKLEAICAKSTISSSVDNFRTQLSLSENFSYPAWPRREKHIGFVNQIITCAQELGLNLVPKTTGGASDSAYMAELVPTVDGLGPVGSNVHIENQEYLLLNSISSRALLHIYLIKTLFANEKPETTV